MGIISTLFVGLIVGALARLLLPGKQSMGWTMTCLLGVAGSLVAGYVGQAMGGYTLGQPAGWLASTVGAMLLVFVYVKLRGASAKN